MNPYESGHSTDLHRAECIKMIMEPNIAGIISNIKKNYKFSLRFTHRNILELSIRKCSEIRKNQINTETGKILWIFNNLPKDMKLEILQYL